MTAPIPDPRRPTPAEVWDAAVVFLAAQPGTARLTAPTCCPRTRDGGRCPAHTVAALAARAQETTHP